MGNGRGSYRIKVKILADYYGTIMTKLGKSYLGSDMLAIHKRSIKGQWGITVGRLEIIPGFNVPDEFNGLIPELKRYRDKVEHNFLYNPLKENVDQIRQKSEDWKGWIQG